MKPALPARPARLFLIGLSMLLLQSCYHYRVLNTVNDPATEYKSKVLWSYAWGLVNAPQNFRVPNCDSTSGLDEVQFSKNFGQSVLTVVTLGVVAPVGVKWKCHKPCQRVGNF